MFRRRTFRVRDYRRLWDDSSSEEVEEQETEEQINNQPSNIELIDLSQSPEANERTNIHASVTPTRVNTLPSLISPRLSSILVLPKEQYQIIAPYIPRTLQVNSRRYSILPAFPTSIYNNQPTLLLANVPSRC